MADDTAAPAVLTERQGHLLIVTLNRPERKNAINGEMLVRMLDAFVEADTNPDIRALVLTGAGGDFCSGADLKEMAGGHSGHAPPARSTCRPGWPRTPICPGRRCCAPGSPNVPIILAAEGAAIAGGTELLGATEIRVGGRVDEVRHLRGALVAVPDGRLGRAHPTPDPLHGRLRPAADRAAHLGPGGAASWA